MARPKLSGRTVMLCGWGLFAGCTGVRYLTEALHLSDEGERRAEVKYTHGHEGTGEKKA